MSTQKNLITLCIATVFTLGLAACGGGGDAPVTSMMDTDGSLEGKYIPSGTTITGVDALDVTLTAATGERVDLPGLGTVECASDECSVTVEDGVLTIMGDLKIVSVDPALDSDTAMFLAGLAVDMLPDEATEPEPEPTPAEQLAAATTAAATAQALVDALTSTSTAADASAAYAALGAAQVALHAATNLPANQIAALQTQIDDLTTNADDTNTMAMQFRAVVDAVNDAQAAIDALTDDSTDADVAAANAMVAAARTALTGAEALGADDLDRLGDQVAFVETGIAAIQTARADRPDPAVVAAATGEAATKAKALVVENAQTPDDGIGGLAATDDYDLEIARDRTGTTIKIDDDPMAAADDPKFEQAMGDLGSGRTMHVRTMDADADGNVVEEVVIVSTDIQAPKATKFADVAGQTLDVSTNVMNDDDPAVTNEALAVAQDMADVLKLVKSGDFVPGTGTSTELTFARYQMDSDDAVDGDQTI